MSTNTEKVDESQEFKPNNETSQDNINYKEHKDNLLTNKNKSLNIYYIATSFRKIDNIGTICALCILSEQDVNNIYTKILREEAYTSQSVELFVILECLNISDTVSTINIYSRSLYAVNCINLWSIKWKEEGWSKQSSKNPTNINIVKTILDKISELQSDGRQVIISHIPKSENNIFSNSAHNYITIQLKNYINNIEKN